MQVLIQTYRYVKVKKEAMDRLAKAAREGLCVACMQPLGQSRVIRGCHQACWKATKRAVDKGKYTEDQRIAEGKLLNAESGGRPPSNPVTIEAMGL